MKKKMIGKVLWMHREGYSAPHQVFDVTSNEEADLKRGRQIASQSRLFDFPNVWKWRVVFEWVPLKRQRKRREEGA